MFKTALKLIGLAISLTLVISLFSAASVILGISENGTILFQIAAFLLFALFLIFYMKKKDPTLKQFGFTNGNATKKLIAFIALIVLIQPLFFGINFSLSVSTLLLIVLQMILVGFVEETLFRSIFFYYLKGRDPKVYICFSSIVFGILHIASGLNPETAPALVVLQIINALLLGGVFSLLYYSTKSIYTVITFHALFNIFASLSAPGSLAQNLWVVSLLSISYLAFLIIYPKFRVPAATSL